MNNEIKDHDELAFAQEVIPETANNVIPWKIMIVDDEIEIHHITEMVLSSLKFRNKGIDFIHASSGEEALIKLQQNRDVAVILLDVVMETENAGLVVVNKLRYELNNFETRIILRTGHPGYAPENKIIIDYDINDYKEKTEMTAQKLITSVISALRSYEDIMKIKELNQTLEMQVKERTRELEDTNKMLKHSLNKIREDLEAGRRIQFRLLPERDKRFGEYLFSRFLIPSMYLSGDFVDYFAIDENHTGFYFADVCGHGASSAFITVLLKSLTDNYIKDHSEKSREYLLNPSVILSLLNEQILAENIDKHLTLFYGVIDLRSDELIFAHGGQFPHPVIYNNHKALFLDNKGGMPLGMYKNTFYENHIVKLERNFIFVMFSDGILEVLPQESLTDKQDYILSKIGRTDLSCKNLMDLFEITTTMKLQDDITFLTIRR